MYAIRSYYAYDELAEARDRDQIVAILTRYLEQEYQRCALFMVKGRSASGWMGVDRGVYIEDFALNQYSLDEPSVLKTVEGSRSFFLGPIPDTVITSYSIHYTKLYDRSDSTQV